LDTKFIVRAARRRKYPSGRTGKGYPGWKFPVRTAPLAVLSSAAMPSLLFEIGNLNNTVNAQTLLDVGFQAKLVNSMVDAIQRFSETSPAAGN
jgi:N-acetylmuramoyl-L-alanine amidase